MIALNLRRIICASMFGLLMIQGARLAGQDTPPPPPQDPVHIRVYETDSTAYPDIKVYFSVLNRQNGRALEITQDNIEATLGTSSASSVPVTVQGLESQPNTARKLNLVLCFDLTSSNTADFLLRQQKTALALIDDLDVTDAVAIVTQSNDGSEVVFPLKADHGGARNKIDELKIVGGEFNTFYDGVEAAIEALPEGADQKERNAVVIMTDVVDPKGSALPNDIVQLANSRNTPLYMIGYNEVKPEVLNDLADRTNGFTYLQREGDEDFDRLTEDITRFLNQEYVLTLHSSLPAQGKTYQLALTLDVSGGRFSVSVPDIKGTLRPLTISFPTIKDGQEFSVDVPFEPEIAYADGTKPEQVKVTYTLERTPRGPETSPLSTGDSQNPNFTWPLKDQTGGEYEVKLAAEDIYGNTGEQIVRFVVTSPLVIDFVDPETLTPIKDNDKTAYFAKPGNPIVVRVAGSFGVSDVSLLLDSQPLHAPTPTPGSNAAADATAEATGEPVEVPEGAPQLYQYVWDSSSLAPGTYTLSVEAKDTRGNSAIKSLPIEILLNSEDPLNILIFVVIIVILVAFLTALTLVRRSTQKPTTITPPPVVAAAPAASTSRPRAKLLVVANGVPGQKEFLLLERNYIVGRGDTADVQVVGLAASRTHAELHWDGSSFTWIELTPEKKNPAFVNGYPVNRRRPLQDGDQIQLGDTVLQFRTMI